MRFIIDNYIFNPSFDMRDNLFTVIFDTACSSLKGDPGLVDNNFQRGTKIDFSFFLFHLTKDDIRLIFDLFRELSLSQSLYELFIYVPPDFVESFTRFLYFDRFKKTPSLAPFAEAINKQLLVAVLYEIESLAKQYNTVLLIFLLLFSPG